VERSGSNGSTTLERSAVDAREDPRSVPPPDLIGRTLLHFHVVERLGAGGMGIVYKAIDEKLRRTVAIKVLNLRYVADERNREILFREARSAAAVEHPNIANIYDVHEADGSAFIAMELVRGKSLRARLAEGRLDVRTALSHAREIALALAAAHEVGVVHRDLKADNVMIAERGHVKVLDFGLAAVAYEAELAVAASGGDDPPLAFAPTVVEAIGTTAVGRVMGTPAYMSPEQTRAEPVDPRTDVFAFGVLLYEMIVGVQPFRRRSDDPREWGDVDSDDWRPSQSLRAANRTVPRAVESLVARCLAVDATERYANGAALVAALDALPSIGSARARRIATALGLTVAAALAIAAVWWRRGTSDAPPPISSNPGAAAAFDAGMQAWRDGSSSLATRTMEHAAELDPALAAASLRVALWADLERFSYIGSITPDAGRPAYLDAKNHRATAGEYDRALIDAFDPRFHTAPDFKETEKRLLQVIARYPQNGEPLYWLAYVRLELGDHNAGEAAGRAAQVEPALRPAALALHAWVAMKSASLSGSRALLDRCIAAAPNATDCLGERARLRGNAGDCEGMLEDAHAWVAADHDDALAYTSLAEALFALNAPIDSVREAAAANIKRVGRPAESAMMRGWSRIALALGAGDFREAEAGARALRDALGTSPNMSMAFAATLAFEGSAFEAGDRDVLAEVARDFLSREQAWTPASLVEAAMPIPILLFARRAGSMTREEFVRERARRVAAIEAKSGDAPELDRAMVWMYAHALAVETEDDAKDAVAALSHYPPLKPPDALAAVNAGIVGAVYARAGDLAHAVPYLRRGARTCFMMNSLAAVMRSRLLLANALAATGEDAEARALYQSIIDRWGHATPGSVTADEARAELRALR
jgi:serine/threonine-protein kinase